MASRPNFTRDKLESFPKKTRQGKGKHTRYTSTSRNQCRKKYKGQGK